MKILVLHVNGLNLGYLCCYGNDWVRAQNLDRLAAEGIVFDQHLADCPRLSRRSSFTGRYSIPSPDGQVSGQESLLLTDILDAQGVPQVVMDGQEKSAKAMVDSVRKRLERFGERGLLWLDWPALAPPWKVPEEFLAEYFFADKENEDALTPWLNPPIGPANPEGR